MEVKFVKPNQNLIEFIARNMRQADVDEIWASHHHRPLEALMSSWKVSDYSVIIVVNGEPCVMLGLVIHDILSGTGSPWLLGTDNALKYKSQFILRVPAVIDEMLAKCPTLINYVHVKNEASVRWLKRIGFIFDDPAPYGLENELFYRFHTERI